MSEIELLQKDITNIMAWQKNHDTSAEISREALYNSIEKVHVKLEQISVEINTMKLTYVKDQHNCQQELRKEVDGKIRMWVGLPSVIATILGLIILVTHNLK